MSSSRRARSRRLKRVLANALVVVLGLVTLVLLVGLFLPRSYRIERSLEIRSSRDRLYPELADLRRWPEWTVWNSQADPAVQFTYDSPDSGVGARYRWNGPKLGRGELRLTKAEPTNGVEYELTLEGGTGAMTAEGTILFEAGSGDAVRVVWSQSGDLGKNPVNRYVGLFLDSMLGPDFEKGLGTLKVRAETGATSATPAPPAAPQP